jgi:hypothetical protein
VVSFAVGEGLIVLSSDLSASPYTDALLFVPPFRGRLRRKTPQTQPRSSDIDPASPQAFGLSYVSEETCVSTQK